MTTSAASALLHGLPSRVQGLNDADFDLLKSAYAVWRDKQPRNTLRTVYFEGKMPLKNLGISTPGDVASRVKAVLSWPAKSVTSLSQRSLFDGFVSPSGAADSLGIDEILEANRFDLELPQAIESAYKHSCSFFTVTEGDTQSGEPAVLVMPRSAEWSAGLWDRRRREMSGLLAITDVDKDGFVSDMVLYTPFNVITLSKRPLSGWVAEYARHRMATVPAEPIMWGPQLDRPFGRSRISRAVMSITDNALRTILRTEVSAEFYAAPRMAALGLAHDAMSKGKWEMAIDRFLTVTRDEDGNVPDVKQFPQMTMQPLVELYRSYASQLNAETGIPVSSLGIVQDNPPSAEAMYAAEKDLITEANSANRVHTASLRRLAQKIVAARPHSPAAAEEARHLDVTWVNPAFTSPTTAANALVQLNAVFPWLSESETALRFAGFSGNEISRMMAEKRRAAGSGLLDRVLARREAEGTAPPVLED